MLLKFSEGTTNIYLFINRLIDDNWQDHIYLFSFMTSGFTVLIHLGNLFSELHATLRSRFLREAASPDIYFKETKHSKEIFAKKGLTVVNSNIGCVMLRALDLYC